MRVAGKRVMVTGGAGFIGSHLTDLLARECEVLVVDDFSTGSRENLRQHEPSSNVRVVEADILDADHMLELCRGIDVIYHLAVQCVRLSLGNPRLVHDVCATGTLNMLQAARHNGVSRFVYVSSSEIYGDTPEAPIRETSPLQPTTPYAAAKLAGEYYAASYLKAYGLESLSVRPFNAYGPRSHFEGVYGEVIPRFIIRSLCGEPPIVFGDGMQTRDFTYVTETAKGILLASQCDELVGGVVNLGSGREIGIRALAELILELTGRGDLSPIHDDARPGDTPRLLAETSWASKTLGELPEISLREGLGRYIEWLRGRFDDFEPLLARIESRNW